MPRGAPRNIVDIILAEVSTINQSAARQSRDTIQGLSAAGGNLANGITSFFDNKRKADEKTKEDEELKRIQLSLSTAKDEEEFFKINQGVTSPRALQFLNTTRQQMLERRRQDIAKGTSSSRLSVEQQVLQKFADGEALSPQETEVKDFYLSKNQGRALPVEVEIKDPEVAAMLGKNVGDVMDVKYVIKAKEMIASAGVSSAANVDRDAALDVRKEELNREERKRNDKISVDIEDREAEEAENEASAALYEATEKKLEEGIDFDRTDPKFKGADFAGAARFQQGLGSTVSKDTRASESLRIKKEQFDTTQNVIRTNAIAAGIGKDYDNVFKTVDVLGLVNMAFINDEVFGPDFIRKSGFPELAKNLEDVLKTSYSQAIKNAGALPAGAKGGIDRLIDDVLENLPNTGKNK